MHKTNNQDLPNEVWVPIRNYEHRYLISNFGRIKYLKTNNILRHSIAKSGKHYIGLAGKEFKQTYRHGKLSVRQKIKRFDVGYLVAMAFKRVFHMNQKYVRYLDGNFDNLTPDNITWSETRAGKE